MAGDDVWRLRQNENNGVLTGATGPQGPTGAQGPQGIQGAKGDTGPIGLTGATGLTGAIGPKGPQGVQGVQGPQGAGVAIKGSVASPSALPATGNTLGDTYIMTGSGSGYTAGDGYAYTGPGFTNVGQIRGPAGANGAQGPQGPAGTNGATGATGAKGDTGPTGAQGPQGATGMTGQQGPQGIQGPAGANGTNGADASAPAGQVGYFAMQNAPTGWLKANGTAVSRSAYATLFAAIGTLYGAGDGSTTFNLPDLRGEFIRGFDDGRGLDGGRAIGSIQIQNIPAHFHRNSIGFDGQYIYTWMDGNQQPIFGSGVIGDGFRIATSLGGAATGGLRYANTEAVANVTSGENRPRNVALLACIKY